MLNPNRVGIHFCRFGVKCMIARPDPLVRGGESVTLAGKHFLDVPEPRTFIGQGSFDWLAEQHRKLIELVDTSWPVDVQLRLLEKGYETIRAAAQAGLIDSKVVASFAEKTFRPSVKQLTEIVQGQLSKSGNATSGPALELKVLAEMRKPVVGCFVAGTLVHTKDGLKPIEQIKVGDWVLSRPENPEEGTETAYKRVVNTFRFEDKPVVKLSWFQRPADDPTGEKYGGLKSTFDRVFATPNHPVWVEGHGWVAVERLHEPGEKRRVGLLDVEDWERTPLRLADGSACHIGDVNDCFRTDKPNVVYTESSNNLVDYGSLWDSAESPPKYIDNGIAFDIENWIDDETDMPIVFTTTVYNIEVEDWHTYFVGSTGLWVHNTDCNRFEEDLVAYAGAQRLNEEELKGLVAGAFEYRGQATNGKTYKQFTEKELNAVLKEIPADKAKGFTFVKVRGTDRYANEAVGSSKVGDASRIFEENGPGQMTTKAGLRIEVALIRDNRLLKTMLDNGDIEKKTFDRLTLYAYSKFENSYITPTTQRVFGDRKLSSTSLVGEFQFKPLLQLFSWAVGAETNPSARFLIEFSKQNPGALAKYNQLFENMKNGTNLNAIVDRDGTTLLTAKEVEFIYGYIKKQLLVRQDPADGLPVLRAIEEVSILKADPFRNYPFPQNVSEEGPGLAVPELDLAHVYLELGQARQYWLDQGASPSRLNQATFAVADLTQGWAARTEGTTVTLDTSGAGWGWFVDTSPLDNTEFVALDPQAAPDAAAQGDFFAAPGSAAEGKLDLLTVLIHELGHVLGLPMPQSADGSGNQGAHVMSQYLSPGQRRLPDAIDLATLQAQGASSYVGITGTPVRVPAAPAPFTGNVVVTNLQIPAGAFDSNNWRTQGNVASNAANTSATLGEFATTQTRLNQVFIVGPQDRYLSFTLSRYRARRCRCRPGRRF
jgi:hypothetical protein